MSRNLLRQDMAAEYDSILVGSVLLEGVGDLKVQDWVGETSLHEAAWEGHTQIVEILLDNKASITQEGQTPLHCAALSGHTPRVELLVTNKATVNVADEMAGYRCTWQGITLNVATEVVIHKSDVLYKL